MNLPAIIPAGGRGTRLRPMTRYISKAMFPLRNRPVIGYVLDELTAAGAEPVVVVGNPDDQLLRSWAGEQEGVRWVAQPSPVGLADALLQGYRSIERDGPVYMALPDNLVIEGPGIRVLSQGLDSLPGTVLGTVEVSRKEAFHFGNSGHYRGEALSESEGLPFLEQINWRQPKGEGTFVRAVDSFPARRTVGRAILTGEFFRAAGELEPDSETGELDDGPVFQELIKSNQLYARSLESVVCDLGEPDRYNRAQALVYQQGFPTYAS